MKVDTAKELKNRTGEVLRPFPEAWAGIEAQLKATMPHLPTWKEALRWSRRRAQSFSTATCLDRVSRQDPSR
jgi:hypothetical protein